MYFISKKEFAEKTLVVMKKLNSIWNKGLVRSVLPLEIASLYNSMRSRERVVPSLGRTGDWSGPRSFALILFHTRLIYKRPKNDDVSGSF